MRAAMCLWIFLIVGCAQADSLQPYPINPIKISEYVTIVNGVRPLRLPLAFIKNSKLYGGDGFSILLTKKKGISVGNHTKDQWKPVSVLTSQIPELIFKGDFSDIPEGDFKKQVIGVRDITITRDVTDIGYIKRKDLSLYIAVGGDVSTIYVTSNKNTDMFTQISINGLSKKEIEDNIIQGILQ